MRSGTLRHNIDIQKKIVSRTSMGEEQETWESYTRAWASVEPITGREYFQANQTQAPVDYKITMRYQAGIKPHWRVVWGSRIFDILSPINVKEANIELILYCKEFVK